MLRLIGLIVVISWILGFLFKIGGAAIHILLVVGAAMLLYDFFKNKA